MLNCEGYVSTAFAGTFFCYASLDWAMDLMHTMQCNGLRVSQTLATYGAEFRPLLWMSSFPSFLGTWRVRQEIIVIIIDIGGGCLFFGDV